MMTSVVSSLCMDPDRRCSSTQVSQVCVSRARSVFQGSSEAAWLARNQQARASVARISRSPGAHSPLLRQTLSHNPPALAGLLHTRAGLLSNSAASSSGKEVCSRSSRTTKKQLSPTASTCQEKAVGGRPAPTRCSVPAGSRTRRPAPSPLRARGCGPMERRPATHLAPGPASRVGNPRSGRICRADGRRRHP